MPFEEASWSIVRIWTIARREIPGRGLRLGRRCPMVETRKKRVLVVEDDEDVVLYLTTWLSDNGFEVEIAKDGNEATEKLKANPPDLITLDVVMPQKSGVKFYKEVKRDPQYGHIPVIIITGLQPEFKKFISHRRAAPPPEGYISKPFGDEELREAIAKVLGERGTPLTAHKRGNCA
jgi:CheY-like chemotaxis protein